MKLHPINRFALHLKRHYLAVIRAKRCWNNARGDTIFVYDKRVVSSRRKLFWNIFEYWRIRAHQHGRRFAVHHIFSPLYMGAKRLTYSLMSKTNTKYRDFGVDGPGEIIIFSGFRASISSTLNSSLRITLRFAPSSLKYCTIL